MIQFLNPGLLVEWSHSDFLFATVRPFCGEWAQQVPIDATLLGCCLCAETSWCTEKARGKYIDLRFWQDPRLHCDKGERAKGADISCLMKLCVYCLSAKMMVTYWHNAETFHTQIQKIVAPGLLCLLKWYHVLPTWSFLAWQVLVVCLTRYCHDDSRGQMLHRCQICQLRVII